jgi:hypothetical protein
MMLTESPEEIFLRFGRPKTVWFELAHVKSVKRFLAFRAANRIVVYSPI